MEILVHAIKSTFRLKYVLNLVFKDLLGVSYRITSDSEEYKNYNGAKINYSSQKIEADELFIRAGKLLFQSGIKAQNLYVADWKGEKVLYSWPIDEKIPFDLFSAVFFLVTRYEEYLPHMRDQYNRFEAESSIAYVHKFLEKPIVNYWVKALREALSEKFPSLRFTEPRYEFISTIDIDNAYAFCQKGVMRTIGGYVRAIVNLNWKNIKDRSKVLLKLMPDPFDSYSFQLEIQKKYKLKVIYFFLLGDYGVNDKNLPSNNRHLQKLIRHLSDYAEIGIHPSFGSNEDAIQVRREISRLTAITHKNITKSRQHFARLHFPATYKILIEHGIQNDYSMGYHNHPGFRAGISCPFYWYDIDSESETNLRLYPYIFSEATIRFGLQLKPSQGLEAVRDVINEIKKTGGTFTAMFHNESLGNYGEWKGWKALYEQVVAEGTKPIV
jgi:hypothetical protein